MLGQEHAAAAGVHLLGFRVQQLEQLGLLGVIRARRVTRGRADTAVLLLDQRFVIQHFVLGVAPVLFTHLLVQPLGAGFGQAVGQGLDHDRVVVIAGVLVGLGDFFGTDAGGGDKATDVVGYAAVLGRDEVGQGEVRLAVGLDDLLAQMVQPGNRLAVIAVDFQVIVLHLVGRPETEHRAGADEFFVDQLLEHFLCVGVQRRRRFTHHFIGEDARELAGQVPGDEERCPVDVLGQDVEIDVVQHLGAGKRRLDRRVAAPVELRLLGDGGRVAQALGARAAVGGALAHVDVFQAGFLDECRLQFLGQQLRRHAHGAGGVGDVDHRVVAVFGLDLHGRVGLGSGGATDHQRQVEILALHLAGDVHHLVQGRGDQPRQADDVALLFLGHLQDFLGRDHHAQVDDVVAVATQHHADDVLADVVHVALHRGHQDLALGFRLVAFFQLDERDQVGHGLLHHPGGFHHLGQEHFAGAEQVADDVHAGHQRAFDHLDRARERLPGFLGVFDNVGGDALDQRVFQALVDFPATPFFGLGFLDAAVALVLVGNGEEGVGAFRGAVEHHVFHRVTQLGRDLVVDLQLAGVDDTHRQAVADRIQQEHRVDRFTHRVVATERERHVGHAARGQRIRQLVADVGTGVDEIDGVVVVLFDTGGDREDVRVEDNVFRREADFIHQDVVGAFADFFLARFGVGLAGLVERHHHHRRAVALAQPGVVNELLHAFLHADGVDDALALDALQAGFDHFPLGGVDHDRHAGDVRLAGNQIEEGHHGLLRIQHAFVHVDVDHLGAGFHLLQGDFQGLGVVVFTDQAGEAGGTGDIGALADVDEQRAAIDGERFQARQAAGFRNVRDRARCVTGHGLGDGFNMARGGTAATTDDVQEAALGEFFDDLGGFRRQFIVLAEFVGQAGVRVGGNVGVGLVRQLFQVRTQLARPQCAVQAHRQRLGVADRVPEGFGGLARQGAAGGVGDGAGDHDRQFDVQFFEHALYGEDRGLGVEGVENGFDQDQVGAAFDQAFGGFGVVFHQLIEGHVAVAGVVYVGRQRAGTAGRTEHAGDEARLGRVFQGLGVGDLARQARAFYV